MSIVGCISHQKNSCPNVVSDEFRSSVREKWRLKNRAKRKESKIDEGAEAEAKDEDKEDNSTILPENNIVMAVKKEEEEAEAEAEAEPEAEAEAENEDKEDNSTMLPEKNKDMAVKSVITRNTRRQSPRVVPGPKPVKAVRRVITRNSQKHTKPKEIRRSRRIRDNVV